MGGYLGIDESNHGIVPEVFVGVYSLSKCDSHIKKYPMQKDRNSLALPNDQFYRHVLISSSIRSKVNDDLIKIIAASELIGYFSDCDCNGISRVIFDGSGNDSVLEDILKMVYPQKPRIDFKPRSDQLYGLVHVADNIAYNLARHYSDPNAFNFGVVSTRIDFDMKKYDCLAEKYPRIHKIQDGREFSLRVS